MTTAYHALMGNGRTLHLRFGLQGEAVEFRFDNEPRWRPSVACKVGDGTPMQIARRIAGTTRTVISIEADQDSAAKEREQHETD